MGVIPFSGNLPRMWTILLYDSLVPIWVANKVLSLSLTAKFVSKTGQQLKHKKTYEC